MAVLVAGCMLASDVTTVVVNEGGGVYVVTYTVGSGGYGVCDGVYLWCLLMGMEDVCMCMMYADAIH